METRVKDEATRLIGRNNEIHPGMIAKTIELAKALAAIGLVLPIKKIRFLLSSQSDENFESRKQKIGKKHLGK